MRISLAILSRLIHAALTHVNYNTVGNQIEMALKRFETGPMSETQSTDHAGCRRLKIRGRKNP